MSRKHTLFQGTLVCAMGVLLATPGLSNGLFENRPWQFQTSADKANKAFVLDIIERKQGGFYDGFNTYNTTNIGTQVFCNNNANATGNIADNGQAGPNTSNNGAPSISADSTANSDTTNSQSDGFGNGGTLSTSNSSQDTSQTNVANSGEIQPGVTTNQDTSQTNSGAIDSGVDNSTIDNSLGDVTNGDTNQALNNDQVNSGNQTAGIDGTACNFDRPNMTGSGTSLGSGPLN
ncbi:hypothetical protein C6W92_16105 [Roseovarius sp. A46]|jgi:hypothetical protein|uniref:hypothetical protein n=1 Tax=Roseovarius sp. A46 TaxID=2109331 RepID=UPI0010115559|nr:hypothetical protein [Roseovarius sp. A46]RXV58883.1 hypothetical protein C6W92_16105 [Roseovarius sp. A46]